MREELVFVCENGALVKYRGRTLHIDPVPDADAADALAGIRAAGGLFPLLCGEDSAYIESDAEPFRSLSYASYTQCVRVERLEEVLGREKICKIAVYDPLPAAEHGFRLLPSLLPALRVTLSGPEWCDVSAPAADKGNAIAFLRRRFGLKREECAAFGDQMNDYEMLLSCGFSYVTENAYPPLKTLIPNVIPSNNDGGVIAKIKEILKER